MSAPTSRAFVAFLSGQHGTTHLISVHFQSPTFALGLLVHFLFVTKSTLSCLVYILPCEFTIRECHSSIRNFSASFLQLSFGIFPQELQQQLLHSEASKKERATMESSEQERESE